MARSPVFPIIALLSILTGCTEGLTARSFQSRMIPSVEPAELFEQGALIMRREFRRVTLNRDSLTIVAQPRRYTGTRDSGTASGLVGVPSTMRRTATMRVRKRGSTTVAELRIDIEREDTRRRLVFHQESRLSDSPSYTPIQRDAATTEGQNAVWTLVRRDRPLERALLNELRDWAASLADAEQASQTTPPSP